MERKLFSLEGQTDLVLDPNSNMILNINTSKAEQNRKLRQQKMKKNEEIEALKSDVQEIKAMLQKLLENGTNG
jgi:hypothetical protein